MESFNGIVIEDDQTVEQRVDVKNLQVYGNAIFCESVDSDEVEIFGYSRFRGNVSCDRLDVPGETLVLGNILTESARVEGTLKAAEKFRTEALMVIGSVNVQKKLSAAACAVKIRGLLETEGKINAERVTINGRIVSGGTLSCEILEMETCEFSEIARVYADEVRVSYKPRGDVPAIGQDEYLLTSYEITADDVKLEHVSADTVDCVNADIGPGCRIGTLYYSGEVNIARGTQIERIVET